MPDERRRAYLPWVLLFLVLVAALWADQSRRKAVLKAEVATEAAAALADTAQQRQAAKDRMQAVVDSIRLVEDSLRLVAVEAKRASRATAARWATLREPGVLDTMSKARIIAVGDSALGACQAEVQTCERRVAVATERADSLQGVANSAQGVADTWKAAAAQYQEAAAQWKKASRGPWLRPALEATTTLDWKPQAAFDVTLGRGAFKVLGRVVAGEGPETCALAPSTEAYTCSTPIEVEGRVGVRWQF